MKNRRFLLMIAVTTICWMSLGCTGLTVGPQVKTVYVIPQAGKPCQILENKSLKVKVLDAEVDPVEQDVGGWVAMPLTHWEAVKRNLEKK